MSSSLCEGCGKNPGVVLCLNHSPGIMKFYCGPCNAQMHSDPSDKKHERISLEGIKVQTRCPIHGNYPIDHFCVNESKLCCSMCIKERIHDGHNVLWINEFKKSDLLKKLKQKFSNATQTDYDGILERNLMGVIQTIEHEREEIKRAINGTFQREHEKLAAEEAKITGLLEDECAKTSNELNKFLTNLRGIRNCNKILEETNTKIEKMKIDILELNIAIDMDEQRKALDDILKTPMKNLSINWDEVRKKLNFTRNLFNGLPVPQKIEFSNVTTDSVDISWSCDKSRIDDATKKTLKYNVMIRKKDEKYWKDIYKGKERKCTVKKLESGTEYFFYVRCVIENVTGQWSACATVRTKSNEIDSCILSQEKDKNLFLAKLTEWCGTGTFRLLYRGTRDGFRASDFHRTCDKKGKTLVLIKNIKGHIFGGFASIPWESSVGNNFKQAVGSFLFTLTNMHNIGPTKFQLRGGCVGMAVCHNKDCGPIFGDPQGLWIYSDCNVNDMSNMEEFNIYEDTTRKGFSIITSNDKNTNFKVQEIEVFKVEN